ncbi:hypothetical protein SAMN05216354_1756 [Xylanibacter ruminicola]|jgi:hypothetical protein|uniref:Uncharacterized protein n=1 Tax=Xylanibacter ruminicola TaxID=839 RepID=A0A1H5V5T3_XYLRU|nr:hypothetical protein SAMN05216354_1756 [Xylanibacter ruminicola]SEW24588.1 hypothetical protein SAMN04487827_2303 [Prevotella sp. khp7]
MTRQKTFFLKKDILAHALLTKPCQNEYKLKKYKNYGKDYWN